MTTQAGGSHRTPRPLQHTSGVVVMRLALLANTLLLSAVAACGDSSSPKTQVLVFESTRHVSGADLPNTNGTANILRLNADGTSLMPLTGATATGSDSYGPQWSSDGRFVVFASRNALAGTDAPSTNLTYNIWRVNADGTGLAPLTNATAAGADSVRPHPCR